MIKPLTMKHAFTLLFLLAAISVTTAAPDNHDVHDYA
jgi:hypothetical protein